MQQARKSKLSRAMALTGCGLVASPRRPLISLSSDTRFQEKAKTILRFGITSFRLALIPADANPLLPGKPRVVSRIFCKMRSWPLLVWRGGRGAFE